MEEKHIKSLFLHHLNEIKKYSERFKKSIEDLQEFDSLLKTEEKELIEKFLDDDEEILEIIKEIEESTELISEFINI